MKFDPDFISGNTLLDAVQIGIELGRMWHRGIEADNHKVDGWLWDKDWACANDSRHHRSQYY